MASKGGSHQSNVTWGNQRFGGVLNFFLVWSLSSIYLQGQLHNNARAFNTGALNNAI